MNRKRNIVILHADELVCRMLGCMGNTAIRTPNIDALAREGHLFHNAYTANGVCVPSRATLMTGRYPIAHGVVSNEQKLPPREALMPQMFAGRGYVTGYFGKTHYGREDTDESMRHDGWQVFSAWHTGYQRELAKRGVAYRYPSLVRNDQVRYWPMGHSTIPAEHFFECVIGDQCVAFIRDHAGENFLCFAGFNAPHFPFSPPKPYDTMYDPEDMVPYPYVENVVENRPWEFVRWIKQNRDYLNEEEAKLFLANQYALISMVDDNVGKIVAALKEAGVYDDTLILFTSDHGDYGTQYGMFGKSYSMVDNIMKTALVISHPDHRGERRDVYAVTDNTDILPTILDFAGIVGDRAIQGSSLCPILAGERESVRDAAFAHNSFPCSDMHLHQSMVRQGDWKYVQSGKHKGELYNLADDPWEATNLVDAEAHKEIVNGLRHRLLMWHTENSGGYMNWEDTHFWEDQVHFYDKDRFMKD